MIESYLVAMVVALNLLAPIAALKVVAVGPLSFAAGSLLIGTSFAFLDVLNDWRGREAARRAVVVALWTRLTFFALVVPLLLVLPAKTAPQGYDALLGQSLRLFAAGLASYWASAWVVSVPVFTRLRDRVRGRWFALRYLATSLPVLVVASAVYGVLGFWGTTVDVPGLIVGTVVVRMAVAGVTAPPAWAARRALHG